MFRQIFSRAWIAIAILLSLVLLIACGTAATPTGKTGAILKVVMAEGTQGDAAEPVNPTTVFTPTNIFHAVVTTNNAKPNTKFKAVWYAVDVGTVAPPNTLIDKAEIVTEGTRNIDFFLKPETKWPPGTFRVELFVNDALDQVVSFSVK
ncbi:MAG: hypothetical protein HY070_01060 [Chloroflexi bacterium]|nr:hypothetical protein [Chloroflexota bacterium]